MEQAIAKVEIENAFCVVTRWTFPPGTATGWHRHEKDYVVMPTISGELTIVQPDGTEVVSSLTAGEPYARTVGVEHDVQNRSDATVAFVEVEIIRPAPA